MGILELIIALILILWILGFAANVGGSLIHLLLVILVIVVVIRLIRGRRVL